MAINFRSSAESFQDCAANEAAGSASDEGSGAVATAYHFHFSCCYFRDHLELLPLEDTKEDLHGCLAPGLK